MDGWLSGVSLHWNLCDAEVQQSVWRSTGRGKDGCEMTGRQAAELLGLALDAEDAPWTTHPFSRTTRHICCGLCLEHGGRLSESVVGRRLFGLKLAVLQRYRRAQSREEGGTSASWLAAASELASAAASELASADLLRPLLSTDHHLRLQEVEMLHVFMHTGPDDQNGLCSWNNRRGRTYVGPVGRAPSDPPGRCFKARRNSTTTHL